MKITVKMVEWFDQHWYKIQLMNGKLTTDWYASVTTKLGIVAKDFLPKWRGDIGNREADMRLFEAQERGTRIHHAWSVYCTGGTIVYNPWQHPNYTDEEIKELTEAASGNIAIVKYQDEMLALVKLQRLVDILKPKMISSERVVYSIKNRDAGTIDNDWEIAEGDYMIAGATPVHIVGGRYVVDLKSGNVVDDNAYCQTAAYLKCLEEMAEYEKEINPEAPDPVKYAGTLILHTSAKTKKGIEGFAALLRTRDQVEQDYHTYRITAELWERKNEGASPRVFEFPSLIKMQVKEKYNGNATASTAAN